MDSGSFRFGELHTKTELHTEPRQCGLNQDGQTVPKNHEKALGMGMKRIGYKRCVLVIYEYRLSATAFAKLTGTPLPITLNFADNLPLSQI